MKLRLLVTFLFFASCASLMGQKYELNRACYNTSGDDFGVRQLKDKLVLVSAPLISDQKKGLTTDGEYSDLYQVDTCSLSVCKLLSEQFGMETNVNSLMNDGPMSVSDSIIFLTVNYTTGPVSKLGIFYITLSETGWSEVKPFVLNSKEYNITHPAYDAVNGILYFTSDAKGSHNMDIYAVKFNGNNSMEKVELPNLNSAYTEFFPFVSNGALYFTSNRIGGYGGLDLYKYENGATTLLGEPFNSTYDDLAIFWSDATQGYFSSNRETDFVHDEVYAFRQVIEQPIPSDSLVADAQLLADKENELRSKLVDINDTLIKLKARILTSKENLELIAFLERAINNINVSIPEGISDFSVDELQHLYDLLQGTVNSLNNSLQNKEQIKETEVKTDISSINELIKSSKIEQIQFKFNSSIIPDEFKELISGIAIIMNTDKKLKIQLDGHTDNIGRKEYNLYLSRLRAESVRNFLISKGIDSSRISLSYYGMDKPMADNTTEQGRYLNRRVEMKLTY